MRKLITEVLTKEQAQTAVDRYEAYLETLYTKKDVHPAEIRITKRKIEKYKWVVSLHNSSFKTKK